MAGTRDAASVDARNALHSAAVLRRLGTTRVTRPRSFGTGSPKERQLGAVRGIDRAASALDAPASPDSGEMRLVPIDEVRVDPDNPRRLNMRWNLLQGDPAEIDSAALRKEVETIQGLAQTFRQVGQRSPIEVVRDGAVKRIVFGERRYWAARVAELPFVKAIVLRSAPQNVPLVQLVENIQHRQLPLYETVLNLRMVLEREAELGTPVTDATDLIARTGLTRATAYRYWRYMDLPDDVERLLQAGTLGSHDELTAVLKHPNAAQRKLAVERYLAGGSLSEKVVAPPAPQNPRRRGRPKTTVSFGSTKNLRVVQHLFTTLDPDGGYAELDWQDVQAVSHAWKALLARLEERLSGNG